MGRTPNGNAASTESYARKSNSHNQRPSAREILNDRRIMPKRMTADIAAFNNDMEPDRRHNGNNRRYRENALKVHALRDDSVPAPALVADVRSGRKSTRVSRRRRTWQRRRNSKHLMRYRLNRRSFYLRKRSRRVTPAVSEDCHELWISELCQIRNYRIKAQAEEVKYERQDAEEVSCALPYTLDLPQRKVLLPPPRCSASEPTRISRRSASENVKKTSDFNRNNGNCPIDDVHMESASVWYDDCFAGFKRASVSKSSQSLADIAEADFVPIHAASSSGSSYFFNKAMDGTTASTADICEVQSLASVSSKKSWADITEEEFATAPTPTPSSEDTCDKKFATCAVPESTSHGRVTAPQRRSWADICDEEFSTVPVHVAHAAKRALSYEAESEQDLTPLPTGFGARNAKMQAYIADNDYGCCYDCQGECDDFHNEYCLRATLTHELHCFPPSQSSTGCIQCPYTSPRKKARLDTEGVAKVDYLSDIEDEVRCTSEGELNEWRSSAVQQRYLQKYCHTVLYDSPSSPQVREFGEGIHLTDEVLAWYIVDSIVGGVLSWETSDAMDDFAGAEFENDDCLVEPEVALTERREVALSEEDPGWEAQEIFNSWAIVLDDVYEVQYTWHIPTPEDEEQVVAEPHPCVDKYMKLEFFVESLIQFVVLIGAPHCYQNDADAKRRSEVARDLLVCPENASSVFNNRLCPVKEILFQCFSAFETKPPGQFAVSTHVTGLISYIFAVYPDQVREFLMEHQSAAYMLAYYIDLPGVVDLNLRLLLYNSELRPVRSAGIVRDDIFLQYLVDIQWFQYLLFNMLNDIRALDDCQEDTHLVLNEYPVRDEYPKGNAILLFLTRLFEINEVYFRPANRDPQTAEYLFALLRHAIVDHNLVGHILEYAVINKENTRGMDAMNVVLSLMRLSPFVDYVARQIGGVLNKIYANDLNEFETTVPSPNRARAYSSYARVSRDTGFVGVNVGAFECARLKIINFYLEVTRTMDSVPNALWPILLRWYLDPEKRNHVCHAILFSIWKNFVELAPEAMVDDLLPTILDECVEIIFDENLKHWCDMHIVKQTDCLRMEHTVRFTKRRRYYETNGTTLHLILFVAELVANKSREFKIGFMPDLRRLMRSSRFLVCYRFGRERQVTTLKYAGSAFELKRKPSQSPPRRQPSIEMPLEFSSLCDPPRFAPPVPPMPLLLATLYAAPVQRTETREFSREDPMWDNSFQSGVITFMDYSSLEKTHCEKERMEVSIE